MSKAFLLARFPLQPPQYIPRQQHLPKSEPEAPKPGLMLRLVRTRTRIPHHPRLKATVESTSASCIAATVRHDTTDDYPSDLLFLE